MSSFGKVDNECTVQTARTLHCLPKKHVTTSSTINSTRIIRLQKILAQLLQRV